MTKACVFCSLARALCPYHRLMATDPRLFSNAPIGEDPNRQHPGDSPTTKGKVIVQKAHRGIPTWTQDANNRRSYLAKRAKAAQEQRRAG
jgi:hypothetical protein